MAQKVAERRAPRGTFLGRVIGRTLDAKGRPSANTVGQDEYVEDLFEITTDLQASLAKSVRRGGEDRVPVPGPLARLIVMQAYLGQLDVRPASAGAVRTVELWAHRTKHAQQLRIEGTSQVVCGDGRSRPGDRAMFTHDIDLRWEGFIDLDGDRITGLVLVARGRERLVWRNPALTRRGAGPDVSHLPAGKLIDFDGSVIYGLDGRP